MKKSESGSTEGWYNSAFTGFDNTLRFNMSGYFKEVFTTTAEDELKAIVWACRDSKVRVLTVHKRYGGEYIIISCQLLPNFAEGLNPIKVSFSKDRDGVAVHYPRYPGGGIENSDRWYTVFGNPKLNSVTGTAEPIYSASVATGEESEYSQKLAIASVSDGFKITAPISPNKEPWCMTTSPLGTSGVSSFIYDGVIVVALHVTTKHDMHTTILLAVPESSDPDHTNIIIELTKDKSVVSVKLT